MCSDQGYCRFAAVGFPIRTSPDQRLYTATRGFSQCPTSFFGIWRLGIHRKPLVAYLHNTENSDLFLDFLSSFMRLLRCAGLHNAHYSVFKVRSNFRLLQQLTAEGQLRFSSGAPLNLQLIILDKTARQTAGLSQAARFYL